MDLGTLVVPFNQLHPLHILLHQVMKILLLITYDLYVYRPEFHFHFRTTFNHEENIVTFLFLFSDQILLMDGISSGNISTVCYSRDTTLANLLSLNTRSHMLTFLWFNKLVILSFSGSSIIPFLQKDAHTHIRR